MRSARPCVNRPLPGIARESACAATPDGADRWSRRLLADELLRLEVVERISHATVRQALTKTTASHG